MTGMSYTFHSMNHCILINTHSIHKWDRYYKHHLTYQRSRSNTPLSCTFGNEHRNLANHSHNLFGTHPTSNAKQNKVN